MSDKIVPCLHNYEARCGHDDCSYWDIDDGCKKINRSKFCLPWYIQEAEVNKQFRIKLYNKLTYELAHKGHGRLSMEEWNGARIILESLQEYLGLVDNKLKELYPGYPFLRDWNSKKEEQP